MTLGSVVLWEVAKHSNLAVVEDYPCKQNSIRPAYVGHTVLVECKSPRLT
jgi:hypothetical protein